MEFSRRLRAHRGRANPFCTTALVIYKERTRRLVLEEGGCFRVPDGPGLGIEVDIPLMRKLAEQ